MKLTSIRFAFAAAFVASALVASADTLYSNLDPAPGSYSTQGVLPYGTSQGFQFTATLGGTVSAVEVPVWGIPYGYTTFNLSLYADNGSNRLGQLLATQDTTTLVGGDYNTVSLKSIPLTGLPPIVAGHKYWVVINGGSIYWNWTNSSNALHYDGSYESYDPSSAYYVDRAGAMRVVGQAVPEPATFLALGLGAGLLCRRKKS